MACQNFIILKSLIDIRYLYRSYGAVFHFFYWCYKGFVPAELLLSSDLTDLADVCRKRQKENPCNPRNPMMFL